MRWFRGWIERCRTLLGRKRFEAELDEEIRFHLEEATRRNIHRGMTPDAARREAYRALGGVETTKERVRHETGVRLIHDVIHDLRYAFRGFRKRPGFTLALLVTIGVAIGANAAVFSVVRSILLRPLPFDESDRIVRVYNSYPGANVAEAGNSARDFYDRRDGVAAFEEVALYTQIAHTMGSEDGTQHVFAMQVTPSFFSVFRERPLLGTVFPDDLEQGAASYAVVGEALWRSALGGDPNAVGSTVILDGSSYEVIGVMPESYRFATWDVQVFTPLAFAPEARFGAARNSDRFHMAARLESGATLEVAQTQLDRLNETLVGAYSAEDRVDAIDAGFHSIVRGYLGDLTRGVRTPLMLLWLGALVVFVAGGVNVTTLFLIRTTGRMRELSARLALGASRARVLRQLLVEAMLVATVGGLLGIGLAHWCLRFLSAFEVYEIPRVDDVQVGAGVVLLGVAASLLLGVAAALVPVRGLLWGGDARLSGRPSASLSDKPSRAHHALVGAQVAFAVLLIMTTGLLVESLRNLGQVEIGFDPTGVTAGATNLPRGAYPDAASLVQFGDDLVAALAARPGIEQAAVASQLPFSDSESRTAVAPGEVGTGTGAGEGSQAYATIVSEEYFAVMGMPVLEGRGFTELDAPDSPAVVVIDAGLASAFWSGSSPIGRTLRIRLDPNGPDQSYEVVGVVPTIRQNDLTGAQLPGGFYLPAAQWPNRFFRIVVKGRGEPSGTQAEASTALSQLDPSLLYYWPVVLAESVEGSLLFRRLPMRLLSVFAFVSLLLVVLGVYGVTTHAVRARTHELGLRMALGGTRAQVAQLLGREWTTVVGIGVVVGMAGSLVMLQVVRTLLYGTSAFDMSVVAATLTIVLGAATIAFVWPVRHALRIDPARALGSPE